jgi:hypothetical protein
MGPFLGSTGIDTPLEYGVWLKIAAQFGLSAIVCSHDAFAMHQTAFVSIVYGKLHDRDVLVLLNKKAGLQYGHVECIYDAQYCLNSNCILFNLISYVQDTVSSHFKHKSSTHLW